MNVAPTLLAFAVWKIFPNVRLSGGYADERGFSYDFYFEQAPTDEMIPLIETEMAMLAKEEFAKRDMMRENAANFYNHHDQPLLAELVLEDPSNILEMIQLGKMFLPFEGELEFGVYKILKMEHSEGKTRIYGVDAKSKQELKALLKKTRGDHRQLGVELGYFTYLEEELLWLARGAFVKRKLEKWYDDSLVGFTPVQSPEGHIAHEEIYQASMHRQLPIRYGELYRSEEPHPYLLGLGALVPQTKDCASIFCREDQVLEEVISSLQFMLKTIKLLDLEPRVVLRLATHKKNERLNGWLREGLMRLSIAHDVERAPDGSAIVIKPVGMKISLREMQKTVVLNRVLFDSIECLIALLLEENDGFVPFWLDFEQARVLPVKRQFAPYANRVCQALKDAGIRAEVDEREEALAVLIHAAERQKVPLILVVGDEEEKTNTVALRVRAQVKKQVQLKTLIEELNV